ncbi:hypothetical protein NSA47_13465 [Irregularibacter muris]|uniref:DUF4179 domain-containing protein n=1 Tax=Irregularibacter muris TaxID=1796619 RepID=A0AAE3L0I2_9FIRM|nr:hypothetical protein [Irregularibacter muris]MCR1899972.1 hypothetical protein [Irregularibacter muris]
MFKEKYHSMNEQIFPDQELINRVMHSKEGKKRGKNKVKMLFPKPMIIAVTLMIIVLTSTPVLAANIPAVYELMHLISPSTAQFFMPIQKSTEDNRIKMEVVSAYTKDNTIEIYITMQDLIGGRIDETTDLYDSYSIHRPFDSSASCSFVGYDESTKTATFLITITEWKKQKIVGDKITFSVREFLSDKQVYNNVPIEVDLKNVDHRPSTNQVSINGFSGDKEVEDFSKDATAPEVLIPSRPMDFPIEGIDLTGLGYINGKLHIQTSVVDNLRKDNHGHFFLRDKQGNEILYDYSVHFTDNSNGDNRVDYVDYVFDIPQSEMDQYSLYGNFITSGLLTKGNWQVTFPIEEMKKD